MTPTWLGWLGFSAGLHVLAVAMIGGPSQWSVEMEVERAPQSHPIQISWVRSQPEQPSPPEIVQAPPSLVSTSVETERSVPDDIPKVEKSIVSEPQASRPTPSDPVAEVDLSEVEPAVVPQPVEPAESEVDKSTDAPPEPKQVEDTAPQASAAQLIGGELRETGPMAVLNPAPRYPRAAVARGCTGTVWLEVALCPGGRPKSCKILESSGYAILDRQALRTVIQQWRFQAGGQRERLATISIDFVLR